MDLTIVIPFYNGYSTIQRLLDSIPYDFPIIIVNDMSDSLPSIRRANVKILNLKTKGYFSGAVNAGIKACSTDVLVLNQDVYFEGFAAFDVIADNSKEYALIGERIKGVHPAWPSGYIHGTFMYMRRDAISKVGLLDAEFFPLWGSTAEWQCRAYRKDFKALMLPTVPGFVHVRGNEQFGSSIKQILKQEPDKRDILIRTPPIISIVVPSYNHGEYLNDLVNSLIGGNTSLGYTPGQTFQSFELIIVDDCSKDKTREIGESLASEEKAIRYYRLDNNSGTSTTCNFGITKSYGDVIARVDADDMRNPNSIEKMYRTLLTNPHSFVYDDIEIFVNGRKDPKVWKMEEYDFDGILEKNTIHAGIMFPIEAWKDTGGYPEEMVHGRDDWAFNIALGVKGYCGVHLHEPGYLYRREGQNRTLRNTTPEWHKKFKEQLHQLFPEIYEGKRPDMCCGQNRNRVLRASAPKGAGPAGLSNPGTFDRNIAGAEGMTLVEYLGDNWGNETFYGPVTGIGYVFSKKKFRRNIDKRDEHFITGNGRGVGILDMLGPNGKPLFKVVKQVLEKPSQKLVPEAVLVDPAEDQDEVVSEEPKMEPRLLPVLSVDGIGETTRVKLASSGITYVHELVELNPEQLSSILDCSLTKATKILDNAKELQ